MTFWQARGSARQSIELDGVDVVIATLDVPSRDVAAARTRLCREEYDRADRFAFERDRNRYIVARATLRELLAERLGTTSEAVDFTYGLYGKPGLAGEDLRFNVSHSEGIAVFAFTQGREIGIDIEAVVDMDDMDDVANHCFSDRETNSFRRLKDSDKTLGFFNCWTRKEAFVKALGDGLQYPLDSFDVTLTPGEPAEIQRIGDRDGRNCGWQLYSFEPAHGFVGAVAVQSMN